MNQEAPPVTAGPLAASGPSLSTSNAPSARLFDERLT